MASGAHADRPAIILIDWRVAPAGRLRLMPGDDVTFLLTNAIETNSFSIRN